jgi:hypothetical protein
VIWFGYRLGFVSGVFGFVVSIHLDPLLAYTQICCWHTLGFVVTTHKLRLIVSIRFDLNRRTSRFEWVYSRIRSQHTFGSTVRQTQTLLGQRWVRFRLRSCKRRLRTDLLPRLQTAPLPGLQRCSVSLSDPCYGVPTIT